MAVPNIKHVVYLMQENQSFDRIFGWMGSDSGLALPPPETGIEVPLTTWLRAGQPETSMNVTFGPGAVARPMHNQPHSPSRTMREGFTTQTGERPDFSSGANWEARHPLVIASRFADLEHRIKAATNTDGERHAAARLARAVIHQAMKHVAQTDVPVFAFLAEHSAICDNWFSTTCSFTVPNRAAFLFDSLDGVRPQGWTLFKALSTAGVDWAVYTDRKVGETLAGPLITTRTPAPMAQSKSLRELSKDVDEWDVDRPTFTYVETRHVGNHTQRSNDHRLAHLWNGQRVVKTVYDALRAREEIWDKTLMIISYDEHGGWYDHVVPPLAPWGQDRANRGLPLQWDDLYGGRVPGILVSPWVSPGPFHGRVDNTAITALLRHLFNIPLRADGLARFHLDPSGDPSGAGDPFSGAWANASQDAPEGRPADPWGSADPKKLLRDENAWWSAYLKPGQALPPAGVLAALTGLGSDLEDSIIEGWREMFPGKPVPLGGE